MDDGREDADRPARAHARSALTVCVPVTRAGRIEPRWGRAPRVAVARIADGVLGGWEEFEVGWDSLHDAGTEGSHHARVARFLREHRVDIVAVEHIGPGMAEMLASMSIAVRYVGGMTARDAAIAAALPDRGSHVGRCLNQP